MQLGPYIQSTAPFLHRVKSNFFLFCDCLFTCRHGLSLSNFSGTRHHSTRWWSSSCPSRSRVNAASPTARAERSSSPTCRSTSELALAQPTAVPTYLVSLVVFRSPFFACVRRHTPPVQRKADSLGDNISVVTRTRCMRRSSSATLADRTNQAVAPVESESNSVVHGVITRRTSRRHKRNAAEMSCDDERRLYRVTIKWSSCDDHQALRPRRGSK